MSYLGRKISLYEQDKRFREKNKKQFKEKQWIHAYRLNPLAHSPTFRRAAAACSRRGWRRSSRFM
jgi:hypothetical protein